VLLFWSPVQFPEGQWCSPDNKFSSQKDSCSSSHLSVPSKTVLPIQPPLQFTGHCCSSGYHFIPQKASAAHPVASSVPRRTVLLIRSPVQFPEGQCFSSGRQFSSQKDSAAHPVASSVPRRTELLIRSAFLRLMRLIIHKVWWGPVDPNQRHTFLPTKLIKMKLDFNLYKQQPSS